MAPKYTAPSLQDKPVSPAEKFPGYFHNTDPTMLPENALTYPSINGFIPNKDKCVPRLGSTLLGQAATADKIWPIIGRKKRFTTMGGIVTEVRAERTNDSNLKDRIMVLYPNPLTAVPTWYQITENVNPLTPAVGKLGMRARYYFDDWFDTNLNPALSLNLPRLVGVNGTKEVLTWTGGIAPITAIVAATSITTTPGVTWASLGFVDPALGGSGNIVINGLAYAITGGWDTDTLTLADTTGISIGDVATSQIQTDEAPIEFDSCRQNKNYMYYGNWKDRRYFQSNGFGHSATLEISASQAAQNDLVVDESPYTGSGSHKIRVTIDSVNPEVEEEQYFATGNGINDAAYITSGYTLLDGTKNVYKVSIVGDVTLQVNTAGSIGVGDVLKGNTTGATARVVKTYLTGGSGIIGVAMIGTTQFKEGETVTDISTTGVTAILNTTLGWFYNNWFQCFKNDVNFNVTTTVTGSIVPIGGVGSFALIDGLRFRFGNIGGHAIGDYYILTINKGGADTFQWQVDGAAPAATFVPITGALQALLDDIKISFVAKTGHSIGDYWDIQADQAITKAWINFYFTLPTRKPGEGYIYRLPANFWTHAPQEEQMYVNTAYGYWDLVSTVLSADLQSESVSLTPLKQVPSAKVIFPYMIDYLENDLAFITENKKLEMIGRQQLIQLPQIGYLSQPVELDFQAASFENGGLEYLDKRFHVSSPNDGIMFVYDNQDGNKYWQLPQMIPDLGILSIYNNTLISHSSIRNQTMNLFTGTSGDNGAAYTFRMRTAYNSYGDRWNKKKSSQSFTEGYVEGIPPLVHRVFLGVNGCGGILPHDVEPIVCRPPSTAPFGEGSQGSHSFGSDIFNPSPHFNEIYKRYDPIMEYYFAALEIECTTKTHTYSILSLGLNAILSNTGNNDLINQEETSQD